MKHKTMMLAPVAAALLAASGAASAVDFHGYFRSGIAWGSEDGGASCFSLPGVQGNGNGRLGNECGTYGEAQFDQNLFDGKDGVKFDYHVMFGYFVNAESDFEPIGNNWALRQNFAEAKNVPGLGGGTAWIGKRYYQRHDVHITDFFYWNDSGPGAGIENISFGGDVKGSFALFRYNGFANGSATGNATSALDARVAGISLGGAGALEVGIQYNKADSTLTNTKDGTAINVEWTLPVLGGVNKLFLTSGTGSANAPNLGSPNNTPGNQDGSWGVVESLQIQPSADFSGMGTVTYYDFKNNYKWLEVAARPVFHFSDYFKLQFEVAHNSIKPTNPAPGDGTRNLDHFTIAPTIVAGRGFWARPELRLFYSYNKWNDKARDNWGGVAGGPTGQFGMKTNGSIYGLQAEAWW